MHDEGYGDNSRPTLEFESDFANRFRSVGAEGDRHPCLEEPPQRLTGESPVLSESDGISASNLRDSGSGDQYCSPRLENAMERSYGRCGVEDELQRLRTNNAIERR